MLADKINKLNYIVQRNWENLPDLIEGHDDLDLLCTDEDYEELVNLTRDWPYKVDVRKVSDGYYPVWLANRALIYKRLHNGFFIPDVESSFLLLYYHNLYHKNENPYSMKLSKLFKEWIPPIEPQDKGVKIYGVN